MPTGRPDAISGRYAQAAKAVGGLGPARIQPLQLLPGLEERGHPAVPGACVPGVRSRQRQPVEPLDDVRVPVARGAPGRAAARPAPAAAPVPGCRRPGAPRPPSVRSWLMRALSPVVLGYTTGTTATRRAGAGAATPSRRHPAHGERAARSLVPRARAGTGYPTGACAHAGPGRDVAVPWLCGRVAVPLSVRRVGVCGGCVPGVPGRGAGPGWLGVGGSMGGVRVSGVRPCRAWMAESGREGRRSRPFGYRRVTCRCREARGGRGVSSVGPGRRAARVVGVPPGGPGYPLAESSPQIRSSPASPSNSGAGASADGRPSGGRNAGRYAVATFFARAWFAREAPGAHARATDPAAAPGARGAAASGRTVTQSTGEYSPFNFGGCLCVTHR